MVLTLANSAGLTKKCACALETPRARRPLPPGRATIAYLTGAIAAITRAQDPILTTLPTEPIQMVPRGHRRHYTTQLSDKVLEAFDRQLLPAHAPSNQNYIRSHNSEPQEPSRPSVIPAP